MSWFEDREADQRWMQGKHGARMAKELERLGREEEGQEAPKSPGSGQRPSASTTATTKEEPLVSFFGGCEDSVPIDCDLETSGKPDFGKNNDNVDNDLADFFGSKTAKDASKVMGKNPIWTYYRGLL